MAAVAVLAVGGYLTVALARPGTGTGQALSASRLSLPGISVAPPQGWTRFPSSAPGVVVMSPAGTTNNCPNKPVSGPIRCIEAITLSRTSPSLLDVSNPEQAVQQLASGRFSALHSSIRHTTGLTKISFTPDGCAAAFSDWQVTWTAPPDTIEGYAVVRMKTVSQNSHYDSVFIRLSARDSSAQALAQKIVSSIRCS